MTETDYNIMSTIMQERNMKPECDQHEGVVCGFLLGIGFALLFGAIIFMVNDSVNKSIELNTRISDLEQRSTV